MTLTPTIWLIVILVATKAFPQAIENTDITSQLIPIELGFDKNIAFDAMGAALVLNGEIHNVYSNHILKFQILRHLHATNNVRYFLVEAGPAMAYLLNRFLESGQDSLLRCSKFYYNEKRFWNELKRFNESLKKDERIEVLGFDFDLIESYDLALKLMLQKNKHYEPSTNDAVDKLVDALQIKSNETLTQANLILRKLLASQDTSLIKSLGPHKELLHLIANSNVPITSRTKRDVETFNNIVAYASRLKRGNVFGEYGISHVNKDLGSLAHLLQTRTDSPFKGKVLTILPHYLHCTSHWFGERLELEDFGVLEQAGVRRSDLNKIESDISLLSVLGRKQFGKLSKATDYLLIIKNQAKEIE